ncbi:MULTISPECIES: NUDIX hydrolase [unclassified Leptolyngbya]|uniref:NUDIX hydrolase n=1 Tax=unclassified Leptolyngbya TaxID=2650499 RepID=UPI001682464C|nr:MULTISPECIES: NUDIX hydrolase [unclassified Leptolyngbya]MBD1913052.1 NUDIX hydrolase [Leptolyngbya sp. FACHB-8]MBD2154447.1 NUDIX hydrolase [Leptolyngbya sp. FACHB-16]
MRQAWRYLQTALGIIFRHPLTGTSIIPVLPDGKIALIRRRDNGMLSLPGGMVNWGEDLPTSLKRELKEETGLDLLNLGRLVGVYSSPERDPRFHSICLVVEVRASGALKTLDKLEVLEVQAFEPTAIPLNNLSHDHGQQLKDYFSGGTTVA